MKVRDSNGEIKKVVLQANDSIPAGAIVDFEGDVVPEGYEKVEDDIVNTLKGNETNKVPSVNCINTALGSLANAKVIWSGDFNTLYKEKNGLFCGMPMKNPPVAYTADENSNWYILQIYYNDSYYIQIATTLLDHATYNKKIYMRKCFSGTPSSWTSISFS